MPPPVPYVIVNVPPAASVRLVTLIVWPLKPAEPALDEVFEPVGAVQPVGTVRSTRPPSRPPVAAVYVKTNAWPPELAERCCATNGEPSSVVSAIVPAPFAAKTSTVGELASATGVPPTELSAALNVFVPVDEPAVMPPPVPYVIGNVPPAA